MLDIKNAAPMVIDHGTRDLSMRNPEIDSLITPQHLPKIYIFAESGPVGPTFVDLGDSSITQIYGHDTFDAQKKYYTHQTPFLQAAVSAGNNCVVHRLMPPDATDRSNIALYLDVLPCEVPVYEKNADGSVKLDGSGDPIVAKDGSNQDITVAGHKVCWVVDHQVKPLGEIEAGLLTIRNGIQTDGVTQSTQYPIYEILAKDAGEFGNKLAVRMYPALKSDSIQFPAAYLNDTKTYPYYFQLVKLNDKIAGKISPVMNGFGANFSRFVTKKNAIDPAGALAVEFSKVIDEQYVDPKFVGPTGLGEVRAYHDNIDLVLGMLYDAEKVVADPHRDAIISTLADNRHAINMVSFTSSNASPYQTIKVVSPVGSTRLTKNTNLFLKGSSDGTITDDLLDELVMEDMLNYEDPVSEYNDIVLHPASIIYDSGFALKAKKAMCSFISRRKDTFVVLSTYAHNSQGALFADQYSVGVALKTMLELYPESDTFGTPVMRGLVMTGSGFIINHAYLKRTPVTYELMHKAARYMGSSTGAWKNGFSFDRAPGSIITQMKDLDITWVPAVTRNVMWSVGLNFALNYRVKTQFFPALQTVYENDTSVLNSFFTAVAISYLNKIAHSAWRQFTGSISLTNAQLEEKVNEYVSAQVKDKFDGKFVIIPACKVTEEDALLGFSWTLPIKLYANNMKTVMSTYVEAYRMEDLQNNP